MLADANRNRREFVRLALGAAAITSVAWLAACASESADWKREHDNDPEDEREEREEEMEEERKKD